MVKQYKPCNIIKKDSICPYCDTETEVGILLKKEHYFTKSKLVIAYICDKCGKTWSIDYK